MYKLTQEFYTREDTLTVARALLGKVLITNFNDQLTAGIITETEAYLGAEDRACHAYGNKRTERTATMFAPGGVAYIYLCYGIHYLFNVVTHRENNPHAVLIRAIYPLEGIGMMKQRRKMTILNDKFSNGPGKLSQALGLTTNHDNVSLTGNEIWIEDRQLTVGNIISSPRIGVDYAGPDALLPYRFNLTSFNF